jgi:hypothetical protein
MDDNKRFIESQFVKDFLSVYAANGGKKTEAELLAKNVGNNGYVIGQEFTLTGDIKTATSEINGAKQTYIVLTTEEGTELSLQTLMGVSSLKGYVFGEDVVIEFDGKDENNEAVKKSRKVRADFDKGDFENVWMPATRNLLTLAGMIAEKHINLAGKTASYLGTAVKPITAKKKGESNGEKFKEGYARAIETKLWSVK